MKALVCFDDWPFGLNQANETTIKMPSKKIDWSFDAVLMLSYCNDDLAFSSFQPRPSLESSACFYGKWRMNKQIKIISEYGLSKIL